MATLVVTVQGAALFADSRYWVQAEAELAGTGIELVKIPTGNSSLHLDWLAQQVPRGATVAVDGQVLGLAAAQGAAAPRSTRPACCCAPTSTCSTRSGPTAPACRRSRSTNTARRRRRCRAAPSWPRCATAMARAGATHHFVSTVDDIAWITNLRGSDVSYNPVFLAHLLIDGRGATLFVGRRQGRRRAARHAGGRRRARRALHAGAGGAGARWAPATRCWSTPGASPAACASVWARPPRWSRPSTRARWLKSRKTAEEAAFVREAMAEDGAAMCEFYAWFEAALGSERITELTVDEQLSAARARRAGFVGLSFSTIAGFNANGAMPHYRATAEIARGDRRRRPAAHRQRRPVPGRHHRHHARLADRHRQRGDAARLHAGAEGHDEPVARALPARHAAARCSTAWRARRCGPRASSSATAPATAWATS